MTAGLSVANTADVLLADIAAGALYVQLHISDPGAAGTAGTIASVPRESVTWGTPAAGAMAISNTPTWSAWAFTSPSIVTHISFWDASSSGNFQFSVLLQAPETVVTGNNVTLATMALVFGPLAA